MGPIYAIIIGMLLLIVDVRITGIIAYPAYEEFAAQAENTVDMIINHVIGHSMPIDIFSNVVGLIIIMVACSKIVNTNPKAFRSFCFSFIALVCYIFNLLMPFFLNGEARYNIGFFSYIVTIFFECLAFIQAGLVCTESIERVENHMTNMVIEIFMMLTAFSGFIRGMSYFYDLPRILILFYVIQIFFAIIYHSLFFKATLIGMRRTLNK